MCRALCLLGMLLALGGRVSPAFAQRVVALAPLSTLGSEDTSAKARELGAQLERALAALPGTSVMSPESVASALRKAKRSGAAACDGELACLADMGKALGAQVIVTGQLGGLGDARVLYLSAIDCATAKELGSTTWATSESDSAAGAVARLLAPASYVGRLALRLPDLSAQVFIDGVKLDLPGGAITLPVGTHALRVTKPEVRDFVRFVDITYGKTTDVAVSLTPLPVVSRDVASPTYGPAGASGPARRSWVRSWWAVAGGAVVVTAISAAVAYRLSDNFSPDVTLP